MNCQNSLQSKIFNAKIFEFSFHYSQKILMKFDLSKIATQQQTKTPVHIHVDQEQDYKVLNDLIKTGDIIETKIRRKDTHDHKSKKFIYPVVKLVVNTTEYFADPASINISGVIIDSDNDAIKENTKHSLWITDGCDMNLFKNWSNDDVKSLHKSNEKPVARTNEQILYDRELQNKCFLVFQKFNTKMYDLVLYGEREALEATEMGAVKVLLVTDDVINRQSEQWIKNLTSTDRKYHGANIVIYDQSAKNYKDLTNYGGIIAVLKYYVDLSKQNTV
ncbi:hypothetical protein TRFO_15459 [Tritrichomonas foetus]|uniref:eRF1 domain-containing protein n=1 Tax=Tritrichomonas foetus TaxID=1144522 RepID=A0A1J4KSL4_9EUKA|nr:hypothetical protein TRFO_15459 [Tritrichomonas foetus]|eukprot:OHT14279.1 hypothetical protein TRFO_15459 [Tritrichomonas foetus]